MTETNSEKTAEDVIQVFKYLNKQIEAKKTELNKLEKLYTTISDLSRIISYVATLESQIGDKIDGNIDLTTDDIKGRLNTIIDEGNKIILQRSLASDIN